MNARLIDLTGRRFGSLVVVGLAEDRITPSGQRKKVWACSCDCGTGTLVHSQNLRKGHTRSCGCHRRSGQSRRLELSGQRFGRLTVVERAPNQSGRTAWVCLCDCGTRAVRLTKVLRDGLARSCGCLADETRRQLSDSVTYAGLHIRLRRIRGSASEHLCVDCGDGADDWSYAGSPDDELRDAGSGLRYSLNLDDYSPRCRACHARFDRGAA